MVLLHGGKVKSTPSLGPRLEFDNIKIHVVAGPQLGVNKNLNIGLVI